MNEKEQLVAEIKKLQQKDFGTYETFYDLTSKYVYEVLNSILENQDKSVALIEKVYKIVYDKITELKDYDKFYQWLGGVATDVALEEVNTNASMEIPDGNTTSYNYEYAYQDGEPLMPEALLRDMAFQQRLQSEINAFPVMHKIVLQYYYYAGFGISEIAAKMGCSQEDVKAVLSCIRTKIKDIIGASPEDSNDKVYSLSEIPVLWLIFQSVLTNVVGIKIIGSDATGIIASKGMGAGAGATGAGSTGGASAGGAASSSAAGAAAKSKAVSGILSTAKAKIVAGVVAAVVVAGIGTAIYFSTKDDTEDTNDITTEAIVSDSEMTDIATVTDAEEITEETTEELAQMAWGDENAIVNNAVPTSLDFCYYPAQSVDSEIDTNVTKNKTQASYTRPEVSKSDVDEDGNVTYTISYSLTMPMNFTYLPATSDYSFYLRWWYNSYYLADYYTGTVLAGEYIGMDTDSYEDVVTTVEWEGQSYDINVSMTRNKSDITNTADPSWTGSGKIHYSLSETLTYDYTIVAPADYDGLLMALCLDGVTEVPDDETEDGSIIEAHPFEDDINNCIFLRVYDEVN